MLHAAFTFLLAIAYVPAIAGAPTAGRWAVAAIGGALLLCSVPRVTRSFGHYVGAAFIAACAIGLVWTASWWDTIGGLAQLIILAVVFCVGGAARDLRAAYLGLALGVAVSVPIAWLQLHGWHLSGDPAETAGGLFLNKNMLGEAALIAALPLCWSWRRWPVLPLVAVLSIGIFLTGSRGVLVAGIVCAAGLLVLNMRQRWHAVALLLLGLFSVWLAIWMDLHFFPSRLEGFESRWLMWQIGVANFSAWGFGLGTYPALLPHFGYAHNEFIQLGFELGFPSLLLWLLLGYCVIVGSNAERSVLLAVLGASLVSYPLHMPATAVMVALVAGHVCGAGARLCELQPAGRTAGVARDDRGGSWRFGLSGNLRGLGAGRVDVPTGS